MALRVTAILGLDGTGFQQGFARADATVRRFSNTINSALGSRFATLFGVGAMGLTIRRTFEYASTLNDLADSTGIAVEELARFDLAARANGTTLETLIAFWKKLNVAREAALKNPQGREAAGFARFGIGQAQLKSINAQDISRQISDVWRKSENIEALVAPLTAIGGRGATQLGAAFANGLDEQFRETQVISTEQAALLDELGDRWDLFKIQILTEVAPAIVSLANGFKKLKDAGTLLLGWVEAFWNSLIGKKRVNRKELQDLAGGIVAEREDQERLTQKWMDALKARRAASRNVRDFTPPPATPERTMLKMNQLMNDSLVRTGNFYGTGRRVLESLANRQVQLLVSIERHTQKLENTNVTDGLQLGGAE